MINNSREALDALSISKNFLSDEQKNDLDENGYLLFPYSFEEWKEKGIDLDYIRNKVDEIISTEGSDGGKEGKAKIQGRAETDSQRLSNLISKDPEFLKFITLPEVLATSEHVIRKDFHLSSLNMREPLKGGRDQKLHVDIKPREKDGDGYSQCACFLYLDDVTESNGPLRYIPGSHKFLGKPEDSLEDANGKHPEEKYLHVKAGTLACFNVGVWHGGTENKSGDRRRVLFISYRDREMKPQLIHKKFLTSKIKKNLSDVENYLLASRSQDSSWIVKDLSHRYRNTWAFRTLLKIRNQLR